MRIPDRRVYAERRAWRLNDGIDEFFVDATLRSSGLGSKLVAAAEQDMAALGIKRVQLQLKRGNERG